MPFQPVAVAPSPSAPACGQQAKPIVAHEHPLSKQPADCLIPQQEVDVPAELCSPTLLPIEPTAPPPLRNKRYYNVQLLMSIEMQGAEQALAVAQGTAGTRIFSTRIFSNTSTADYWQEGARETKSKKKKEKRTTKAKGRHDTRSRPPDAGTYGARWTAENSGGTAVARHGEGQLEGREGGGGGRHENQNAVETV